MMWLLRFPLRVSHRLRVLDRLDQVVLDGATKAIKKELEEALEAYNPPCPMAEEITLVLDAVIAEQFRLQTQVEELTELLREALATRGEPAATAEDTF